MTDILERLRSTLSERYEIERELGQGGMATVFLARDIRHEREVAIKVLHPELSASIGAGRFEREIKLAARLQHPHILGLYDSGEADKLLFYVMPYVKGESLRDRLEREGQLPIDDAIQIALEVADALGHAHAQGIVHRDIKPENIMLSGGHALVMDFGIARAATEAGGHKLTQTGMAVGTPVYMAPEQAVGDSVGPPTDLYSLGCVLYEMLAGEPPFLAKTAQALMARHAMEAVPSVRIVRNTVPEEVEDAIFASMAKVAADRPQSAAQFAELLGMPLGATANRRSAIRHTASRRVPTGTVRAYDEPPLVPWWKRGPVLLVLALAVLGGGFAAWRLSAGTRPARSPDEMARLRKVAVLYFTYPEANPELGPVADALTEGLIDAFRTAKLDVASRNGVLPFRNGTLPVDSIAARLQTGSVVQGSLLPDANGTQLKVTTWITDAFGNDLGDRSNFTIPRDSVSGAGARVIRDAGEQLRSALGLNFQLEESRARAGNEVAWLLLRRAEKARNDAEQVWADTTRALAFLGQADSLARAARAADPGWIDPAVVQGEILLRRAERVGPDAAAQLIPVGLALAGEILTRDQTNARGYALRGALQFLQYRLTPTTEERARGDRLRQAESDLTQATRLDPDLASAYARLSFVAYEKKDVFQARAMALAAYAADQYLSNSATILSRLFFSFYSTEDFAEARKWCAEGQRRFPRDPTFTVCFLWLLTVPDTRPPPGEAWQLADSVAALYAGRSDSSYRAALSRILVATAIGKRVGDQPSPLADSARRVLARSRVGPKIDPTHELPGYEAMALTQIGDLDQAMALLKEYVANNPDHSFNVGNNIHWWWRPLVNRPDFSALRSRRP